MTLDIGYHVVSTESLDDVEEFDEHLSIVEFLRRVERQEELPYDVAVHGFDELLYGAADSEAVGEYIRTVLRDNVNYLSFHNYRVQFVVDDVEYWEEPVLAGGDEQISLSSVFRGGLTQEAPGVFTSNLNLQS